MNIFAGLVFCVVYFSIFFHRFSNSISFITSWSISLLLLSKYYLSIPMPLVLHSRDSLLRFIFSPHILINYFIYLKIFIHFFIKKLGIYLWIKIGISFFPNKSITFGNKGNINISTYTF